MMRMSFCLTVMMLMGCSHKDDGGSRGSDILPQPSFSHDLRPHPGYQFRAAAGTVDITPAPDVPLAGFYPGRIAEGIHDPLTARCLVLEDAKGNRVAFVSADVVGVLRVDALEIQKQFAFPVIICATHQHSGPDTIGFWGRRPLPFVEPGRDEAYLQSVKHAIVDIIGDAEKRLVPAEVEYAQFPIYGVAANRRESLVLDETLTVLHVRGDGRTIAMVANFGCHPESLSRRNMLITADFPGYWYAAIEARFGGTALFVNGSLGGMVTPKRAYRGFDGAEKMAVLIVSEIAIHLPKATRLASRIHVARKEIAVPLENNRFKKGIRDGLIPVNEYTYREKEIITEVSLIAIGDLTIFTIPGEILPGLGNDIKRLLYGRPTAIFGLANDELGYILSKENWQCVGTLYSYEKTMSVGPQIGPIIFEAFQQLIKQAPR